MYYKRIVEVQGSSMDVLLFEPEGSGPFPGVVVAQHIPVAHAGLGLHLVFHDEQVFRAGPDDRVDVVAHLF